MDGFAPQQLAWPCYRCFKGIVSFLLAAQHLLYSLTCQSVIAFLVWYLDWWSSFHLIRRRANGEIGALTKWEERKRGPHTVPYIHTPLDSSVQSHTYIRHLSTATAADMNSIESSASVPLFLIKRKPISLPSCHSHHISQVKYHSYIRGFSLSHLQEALLPLPLSPSLSR